MNKDSVGFDRIPREVSLRRIKKRAMSYAKSEIRGKHLARAAAIPLVIAVFFTCMCVFAVTKRPWELFFNNAGQLEQTSAVQVIGETRYAGDYKVTLEEAAFGDRSAILLFSVERTDGGKLHKNTRLTVDIPGCFVMSGSQRSRLSEDEKKVYICHEFNYGNSNIPNPLRINITAVESWPTSRYLADWPVSRIYSENYGEIIAEEDASRLDELYDKAAVYPIEGAHIEFFAAGSVDGRLALAYRDKRVEKRIEFLSSLYNPSTGANYWSTGNALYLPKNDGEEYVVQYFEGIDMKDLDHLYPMAGSLVIEDPVPVSMNFDVNADARLYEVTYENGFYDIPETSGLELENIEISPARFMVTAVSDDERDVNATLAFSEVYCLMEDGTRIKMEFSSSGTGYYGGKTRYSIDFTVVDTLLDAGKVKDIYINGRLFWSKQDLL